MSDCKGIRTELDRIIRYADHYLDLSFRVRFSIGENMISIFEFEFS